VAEQVFNALELLTRSQGKVILEAVGLDIFLQFWQLLFYFK